MKRNTYKYQKKTDVFTYIEQFLQRNGFVSEDFPVKYLPQVLYVFFLGLLYVGNTHYYEKVIRKITQLEEKVEDLRTNFITLKADYMFASKQSEVAQRVAPMEIYESTKPPCKIKPHERDD